MDQLDYTQEINNILQMVKDKKITPKEAKERIEEFKTKLGVPSKEAFHREKTQDAKTTSDVAVIGMSGRFPGASNLEEYWLNLMEGKSSITKVPKERWNIEDYYDEDIDKLDKTNSRWGGFLSDIDKFDPSFFHISGMEAEVMDPQQRLFLEECWKTLEDAGYANDLVSGLSCGVYVGAAPRDYLNNISEQGAGITAQTFWGNTGSVLASRISYLLNLKGPAIAIDTACSSSLVAIHLACQSIISGENTMAIAGGVWLCTTPHYYLFTSNAGMLSPEGQCKSFDNDANGIVNGEGVGVVVLKNYDQALKDGDHIYGIIKSSGINQDGKTNGITAPSSLSQTALELEVYKRGNINPETITFIETHGTGTKLGDPIEIEALKNTFKEHTDKKQFCALGSVKTNIGHSSLAAGIASFIKVMLALNHKKIPPLLNFKKENEHLELMDSPFYVNTKVKDWINQGDLLRAAVSSFGFGGTNAHLVVEEFRENRECNRNAPFYLIPFSAKTKEELNQRLKDFLLWSEKNTGTYSIGDISYSLGNRRKHFLKKIAFVVSNLSELNNALQDYLRNDYLGNEKPGDRIDEYNANESQLSNQDMSKLYDELEDAGLSSDRLEEILLHFCEYYKNGGDLSWARLYKESDYIKIPLPTYPFVKDSYWIKGKETIHTKPVKVKSSEDTKFSWEDTNSLLKDTKSSWEDTYSLLKDTKSSWENANSSSAHALNYYQEEWVEKNLDKTKKTNNAEAVLLFGLREFPVKIDNNIIKKETCITVYKGTEFKALRENEYEINPHIIKDYVKLFETLKMKGFTAKQIVYTWIMDHSDFDYENIQKIINGEASLLDIEKPNMTEGIDNIFNLLKSMIQLKIKGISKIFIYSLKKEELPNPFHEIIANYGKSFGFIMPDLEFSTIYVNEINQMNDFIQDELCNPVSDIEVFYNKNKRYIKKINKMQASTSNTPHIRPGSTFLITGGAGKLGLIFANFLALEYKVNLVLVGRSDFDEKIKEQIKELEKTGSSVIYQKADVTNRSQMQKVIEEAKKKFGGLHGVLHAAGMVSDKLISQKEYSEFHSIVQVKILGTVVLDEVTKNEPLEYFILFSSTASIIGDFGQCDYSLGNRFLDCYKDFRKSLMEHGLRSGKTITLNWPLWENGGMHQEKEMEDLYLQTSGLDYLQNKDGIRAFKEILGLDTNQGIIFYGNPQKVEKMLRSRDNLHQKENGLEHNLTPSIIPKEIKEGELTNYLEQDIKIMAGEILKLNVTRIESTINFGDFGFDSISLKIFAKKIRETYDIEISPAVFFSSSTIKGLVKYLLEAFFYEIKKHYYQDSIHPRGNKEIEENSSVSKGKEEAVIPSEKRLQEAIIGKDTYSGQLNTQYEPVAIIGADGIFPGSKDLNEFWDNIKESRDMITEIPASRWDWKEYYSEDRQAKNKSMSKCGGFIQDVDKFDAPFFNISRMEAELMDPQQRLLMQTIWKAYEDAGYKASELWGKRIGVYMGVQFNDYQELLQELEEIKPQIVTGNSHALLANRISYYMNFTGPSESIDTACSGSLVAIHHAVKSIQRGESEMAVAGGVSLMLSPKTFLSASKLGVLSPDNHCKTFDEHANGYVRGEGVGVIVLKPLRQAIKDHDNIYAVIKGSAQNHGGRANSLTAPNSDSQAAVLTAAYKESGFDPGTITYIEAHGTGTELGDPIEIEGLKKAFHELSNDFPPSVSNQCGLGSVKTNIGHLEPAAGIAGIIKVIMAMRKEKLPASINFNKLNPYINLSNSPFYIVDETKEWSRLTDDKGNRIPRRAGVSSFGFGGANAHIVLEEYSQEDPLYVREEDQIIVLSAKYEKNLKQYTLDLLNFLDSQGKDGLLYSFEQEIEMDLRKMVMEITNIEAKNFYSKEDLQEYGFDIYEINELSKAINGKFDIDINPETVRDKKSLSNITDYIATTFKDKMTFYYSNTGKNVTSEKYSLENIAFTLQLGRDAMNERVAFVVSSMDELRSSLKQFIDGNKSNNIFSNNVKKTQESLGILGGDEDAEAMVVQWIRKKKLNQIAMLWTNGYEVNWRLLHASATAKRISLPTYPFTKEGYWLPVSPKIVANHSKELGTLIDSTEYLMSLDGEIVFSKVLNQKEIIVKDHVIKGQNIFPGVGYIEMAYQVASVIFNSNNLELCKIFWLNPLLINNTSRKVLIALKKKGEILSFEVKESGSNRNSPVFAKGEIHKKEGKEKTSQLISLEDIKQRCTQVISGDDIYQGYEKDGIGYGDFFKGIKEIYKNDQEVLGIIHLPKDSGPDLNAYTLHPTLLDSALQTISCIAKADGNINLPFAVEKFEILKPLKPNMYSYVKATGNNSYEVSLINEAGEVCARFHKYVLMEMKYNATDLYYQPVWRKSPLLVDFTNNSSNPHNSSYPAPAIIIYTTVSEKIAKKIAEKHEKAVQILLGRKTSKISEDLWEVKCTDPNALAKTIAKVKERNLIYFLGGIQLEVIDTNNLAAIQEAQEKGVLSLFRLIKALDRSDQGKQTVDLKVITNNIYPINDSPVVLPVGASIHGFVKSLAKEYVKYRISTVDVDLLELKEDLTLENLDSIIISALSEPHNPNGETVVYRNGNRYERVIESIQVPAVTQSVFRENGVYIIIGGAGGIGLILSHYLSKTVKARLFLIGRSELNESKKEKIKEIEELGGTVQYYQADITNLESMKGAIKEVKAVYGEKINGVFHSAIVSVDKMINKLNEEEFKAAFDPKVYGSVITYSVFGDEDLDFMAFFSSTSSQVGLPGQSNYASGLNFKDNFASYVQKKASYPIKVFNWGYWGIGSSEQDEFKEKMRTMGIHAINPREGMEVIERVLKAKVSQVFILKAENKVLKQLGVTPNKSYPKVDTISNQASQPIKENLVRASQLKDMSTDLETQLSEHLRTILADTLKCDRNSIDNNTDFIDFGIDSILSFQIHAEIEKSFGDLPATLFLDNTNINDLVHYLMKNEKHGQLTEYDSLNTRERISDYLKAIISKTLKCDKDSIENGISFQEYGIDSILGFQIYGDLEDSFGNIPTTLFLEHDTIDELVTYLQQHNLAELNQLLGSPKLDSMLGKDIAMELDNKTEANFPQYEISGEQRFADLIKEKSKDIELPIDMESFLVEVDSNIKMEVSIKGTGEPILVIPGLAVTSLISAYQFIELSSNYQVIGINLPGHGRSDGIDDLSFKGISEILIKVLNKLEVHQPIHVVGGSYGGIIAQNIALEYPIRVKTLTLIGSITATKFEGVAQIFSFSEAVSEDFEAVKRSTRSNDVIQNIDYYFEIYKHSQSTNSPILLKYLELMKIRMSTRDVLGQIKVPTLVIVGAVDTVVEPAESALIHSKVKNSEYIEIADGGHFIHLTHHEIVNKAILDFLQKYREL